MRPLCTVKQKSPTHAKESTRDATTNLRQVHGREEGKGGGWSTSNRKKQKKFGLFFFSWLFFASLAVAKCAKCFWQFHSISNLFQQIVWLSTRRRAMPCQALRPIEWVPCSSPLCSTLLCQVPDEFLSLSSQSHCRRQALRSLQFCYRNSHMRSRLLRLGRAP